jgi:hypothetical protein
MARKMYINVTLKVIVTVEEGISVDSVMDNLLFPVEAISENILVEDSEVDIFQLTDSK